MAETVAVDLVVNGIDKLKDLAAALRQLRDAARGSGRVASEIDKVGDAARKATAPTRLLGAETKKLDQEAVKLARSFERAEIATAKYASSAARLQVAQKNLAGAQSTLENGLKRVNAQSAAGIQLQTQLAQVKDRIAKEAAKPTGLLAALGSSFAREAGESIGQAGAIFSAFITGPLAALGAAAVASAVKLESARLRLETVAGSAAEAGRQFAILEQLAKLPGIDLPGAVDGAASLQALGFAFEDARRILQQFSNAIALSGGTAENLKGVIIQLQQMSQASKVFAQDLKPIIQQAPIVGKVIKDAFGTVRSEDIQELGIAPKEFIETVIKGLERLQRAPLTFQERLANLQQVIAKSLEPIGRTILDTIVPALESIAPAIESASRAFASLPAPIRIATIALVGFGAAIGPTLTIFGGLIQAIQIIQIAKLIQLAAAANATAGAATVAGAAFSGPFVAGIRAATTASLAFLATPLGAGLAILGIALTAGALAWANYKSASEEALEIVNKQTASTKANAKAISDALNSLEERTVTVERLNGALSLLDPAEQAYIRTLQSQEEQIKRTNKALQDKLVLQDQLAEIERVKIIEGLAQSTAELDKQQSAVTRLSGSYNAAVSNVDKYGKSTEIVAGSLGEFQSEGESVREGLANISGELTRANTELTATKEQTEKLAVALINEKKSAELAVDEIIRLARAGRLSGEAAGAAIDAIGRFSKEVTEAGKAAETTGEKLQRLLSDINTLSNSAQKTRIRETIETAVRTAGGDVAKAVAELKKAKVGDQIKAIKKEADAIDKAGKAIGIDALDPQKKRSGGGAARRQENLREGVIDARKSLEEEQLKFQESIAQRDLEIERARSQESLRLLQSQYQDQLISIEDFYRRKAELSAADSERERRSIASQIAAQEKAKGVITVNEAFAKANAKDKEKRDKIGLEADKERLKIDGEINRLRADLGKIEVKSAGDASEADRARINDLKELQKQISGLGVEILRESGSELDATLKEIDARFAEILVKAKAEAAAGFPELQDALEAIIKLQRQAAIARTTGDTRIADASADNARAEIQKRIALGIIGEAQARKELLAIQRAHAAEVIPNIEREIEELEKLLKTQEALAQIFGKDPSKVQAIAGTRADILKKQQQVIEIKTQTIDPIFAEIRSGLENDLLGAFNEFIENGIVGLDSLRELALGFVNSFRRAFNRLLSDVINEKIVKPLTDSFLKNILGFNIGDSAQLVATNANTAALIANTSALIGGGVANAVNEFGQPFDAESLIGEDGLQESPISGVFNKIQNSFKKFADGLGSVVGKIGTGLRSILSSIFSFAGSIIGSIFGGGGGSGFNKFAGGGEISGPGTGTSDSILARVSDGEFVEPAHVVRKFGSGFFEGIRTGRITPADLFGGINTRILSSVSARSPRFGFAEGGLVGGASRGGPGSFGSTEVQRFILVDNERQALTELNRSGGAKQMIVFLQRNKNAVNAALA